MRRLVLFARSVIPLDPAQLFLLAGSVFLLISMQLRCHPIILNYEYASFRVADAYQSWNLFSIAARLPIVLAGAAGLFICFWPGIHPTGRILGFVLLPSFAGIAAICGRFLYVSQQPDFPHASVIQGGPHNEAWGFSTLWSLGPALHVSVLGFVLILVFFSRLATGASSLPVSLAHAENAPPSDDRISKRILVFVWISITGVYAIAAVASASVLGIASRLTNNDGLAQWSAGVPLSTALFTACLTGIAAWAIGSDRWEELRRYIRLPETKFGVLGVIFPTAIESVPNLVAYLSDRIHWAAFEFGKFPPPIFASYFYFPNFFYFWYVVAAIFEEIIWRGYLQPRFVQRYGLIRGIFLLGVAWSAFHFMGDFRNTVGDYQVFSQFAFRLTSCITMSYVLGWLTLRSKSIWHAALAHGFSNVWIFSLGYSVDGRQSPLLTRIIVTACWGLLGFALFRLWPPTVETEGSDQVTEIAPEPTV